MEFRTVVDLPKQKFQLSPRSRVVFMGSCFAQNIGERMAATMPDGSVCVNPFGVLYNPESIRTALEILVFGSLFFPDEFLFRGQDGLWHSWLHSGAFSAESREECAEAVVSSYEDAVSQLRTADLLCVTFGTNRVYEHREKGFVVGNCHKETSGSFMERGLGVEEIVSGWNTLLAEFQKEYPALKVVFTISPYRYAKYGFHDSQVAKSTLMLAVDRLCAEHGNACYFPAYEIVLDELRDYRFYDADMLHPSSQASEYVWKRFREWCFSEDMKQYAAEREALLKAEAHRPLHPESEEAQRFMKKLEKQREAFKKKWTL